MEGVIFLLALELGVGTLGSMKVSLSSSVSDGGFLFFGDTRGINSISSLVGLSTGVESAKNKYY